MMAMPIVDITYEKLSSISKMDLNRKVKDGLKFRRLKILAVLLKLILKHQIPILIELSPTFLNEISQNL